jgi:hypothetical protein
VTLGESSNFTLSIDGLKESIEDLESVTYWVFSAEVIKVEHPTRGDDTRAWGPPYAPYTPESGREGPGESAYYLSVCQVSQPPRPH